MELTDVLSEILAFFDDPPSNEANTCDLIIRPMLLALGYLPREINREAHDQAGNRPDYTILPNEAKFRFYIEVKAWNVGLQDKHINQAITYAHLNGDRWVILTNGHLWRLYDDFVRGIPAEKLAVEIDVRNQDAAMTFFKSLAKQSYKEGQLESTIQQLKESQRAKPIPPQPSIPTFAVPPIAEHRSASRYFWHIVAHKQKPSERPTLTDEWWSFLKTHGQITAGFDGHPGDQGECILTGYERGDIILAYAAQRGALGWGIIENTASYRLLEHGDPEDVLAGVHRHRLNIRWQATAPRLSDAISAKEIKAKFGVEHPHSTSQPIYAKNVQMLVEELARRFKGNSGPDTHAE